MSSGNDIIRRVGPEAADLLSKIHQECFPSYWNIESFNDFFSVTGTYALVAGASAMAVYRVSGDQADIITIAVLPAERRRGFGRMLLKSMMAHMKELGVRHVFLDVEDGNTAAIALYERHGFTHLKRRKLYYRQKDGTHTDALVMSYKFP